jgi:hypothetical protein
MIAVIYDNMRAYDIDNKTIGKEKRTQALHFIECKNAAMELNYL